MRFVTYRETIAVIGWEVSAQGKVKSLYANWLWLYLQRCQKVELTKRNSKSLAEINLPAGQNADFGIMDFGDFNVKLLFNSQSADYIRERLWSGDQKITLAEDNNLLLEMTVQSAPVTSAYVSRK